MGGLWAKNCRLRTDQGPPITDLELPHRVRRSGTILQALLPTFCPAKRAPPSPASPPDPASGPRDGGDGQSMRQVLGGGDKMDKLGVGACCPTPSRPPPSRGRCRSTHWAVSSHKHRTAPPP